MTSRSTRARRLTSLREERSASEAYISSNRSWARTNCPRRPFCRALRSWEEARPVFPTPAAPMKTIFSACRYELQVGEGAHLLLRDAGLALEGERFERPLLGQAGALDPPGECGLLAGVPLGAQQGPEQLMVGEVLLLGGGKLLIEDLGDLGQTKRCEQLCDLVSHRRRPRGRACGRSLGRCVAGPCARSGRCRSARSEIGR